MPRKKDSNTLQPAKPRVSAAKKAADASIQGEKRVVRPATNSRKEIREQVPQRQGHPK